MKQAGEAHDPRECGCIEHNPRPRAGDERTLGDKVVSAICIGFALVVPGFIAVLIHGSGL